MFRHIEENSRYNGPVMRTILRPRFATLTSDLAHLFGNHGDAWGVTLCIVTLCLALHAALTPAHLRLAIALTVIAWLAFALNDYWDSSYDARDAAKARGNFFVVHATPRPVAFAVAAGLVAILGLELLPFGALGLAGLAICIVGMWAYSAPPLHFKRRPGLDLLTHAAFVQTGPYLTTLLLIRARWTVTDLALLAIFVLSSAAAQLEQQLRDFEVDSQTDLNSTIRIGQARAVLLLRSITAVVGAIILVGLVAGIFPAFTLPFAAIAMPAVLHRFLRRQTPRSERLIVLSVLVAAGYATVLWGWALR